MKTLLLLSALTLISATSFGEMIYRPGYVQEGSCGFNTMIPSPGQLPGKRPMIDSAVRVCAVSVQGLNSKTPLYSFDIVTAHGEKVTYIFSQVSLKPVYTQQPVGPGIAINNGRMAMAQLQVIGTSIKNQFNTIYFVRSPDVVNMMVGLDKYSSVVAMSGYLQVPGLSNNLPVQVTQFQAIYHTM